MAATADRRPSATAEATSWTNPYAVTGRGGEHDAGREPCVEQLAVRDPRGQHPTQPIHDGGIHDIAEQSIGHGHAIGQPGQARPPREHRFVTGQRLVPNRGSDRHDRGGMETQGHRCALQEPGYPVHRHETAAEDGGEARSVVFHHDRRSIVFGDDIRSIHPRVPQVISAARAGPKKRMPARELPFACGRWFHPLPIFALPLAGRIRFGRGNQQKPTPPIITSEGAGKTDPDQSSDQKTNRRTRRPIVGPEGANHDQFLHPPHPADRQ